MFKKILNIIFKLQDLKNFKPSLSEGKLYRLSLLVKPLKEKPRLFGFLLAQLILIFFIVLNTAYYIVHSHSHTDTAIETGQMALINMESDSVVVGKVIIDSLKKEELARQYQEAQAKNLEKEHKADEETTEHSSNTLETFRAPPLSEETKQKSKIVIIVTDLGLSKSLTLEALQLPKNFTLGFSPYANNVDEWIDQAVSKGFETIINLPMQPTDYPVNDPGPYALLQNLAIGENLSRLDWVLSRSKKIVGVYTSSNETFTSSRANLLPVLENLKKKRKIFAYGNISNDQSLTSLTGSIQSEYTPVHISIDEELIESKITNNLLRLEGLAQSSGFSVGYINPYPLTIKLVNKWLDDLDSKAVTIVPLSNLFDPITEEHIKSDKEQEAKEREEIIKDNEKLEAKHPNISSPSPEGHGQSEHGASEEHGGSEGHGDKPAPSEGGH